MQEIIGMWLDSCLMCNLIQSETKTVRSGLYCHIISLNGRRLVATINHQNTVSKEEYDEAIRFVFTDIVPGYAVKEIYDFVGHFVLEAVPMGDGIGSSQTKS